LDSGQVEQMPIAKLVMSEEEQGLVIQKVKVKVKRKELRIKFQDFISSLLPFALWLTPLALCRCSRPPSGFSSPSSTGTAKTRAASPQWLTFLLLTSSWGVGEAEGAKRKF
jgi:hypothetical protein